MKPIEVGLRGHRVFEPEYRHTAESFGNPGVVVVSTAALVDWLEIVCEASIRSNFEEGEASVGAGVCVRHLAPSPLGHPIAITSEVSKSNNNLVHFEVEARDGDRLILDGTHTRAIVNLETFLEQSKAPEPS